MSQLGLLLEIPPIFKFGISMAMFNSYVKLPEGMCWLMLVDVVKVRDVSSTVVKLQLLAPFAVARTQSVCCQQELTQGLEPQASVDMTC